MALEATRDPLHSLKISLALVHKWLKIKPEFLPTLRKFCILLHCQASHMQVSKRNSRELWQIVESRALNPPKKFGRLIAVID